MEDVLKEVNAVVGLFTEGQGDDKKLKHGRSNLFSNISKAAVLMDARIFHDSHAVKEHPQKCCTILAQLVYLQSQDSQKSLNETEATEVFFGATKLFVSQNASLRRMVYLFLKEIHKSCDPNNVIIVTSCLTKDMTCDVDLYRANSLRVLAQILDSAMLGAIERYVKQAIIDSSPLVASSALVSSLNLFRSNPDCAAIVRRWIAETQEALKSRDQMVQFHAMQLLYQIKSHDRNGVSKLVAQYTQHAPKSPLAIVLLVRYTCKLLHDEILSGRVSTMIGSGGSLANASSSPVVQKGFQFLQSSLRHKSSMVVYEAARAICSLPEIEPQDLVQAISVLQLYLVSDKPSIKFASMRTLATLATHQPRVVSKCNAELELLATDSNRLVATLAITTLLQTGSENSIDRLLQQISTFLHQITDEYKITIVKSLQKLCLTYPSKHHRIVGFLAAFLRDEGGFEFKRTIISGIVSLMRALPETVDSSLLHLCEFIEDCEYTMLTIRVLHLIADWGPKASHPPRYIRFVYNRVMLENATVRAAAISVLAKFAARCPSLRESILALLKPSLMDEDDETRDRAACAAAVLEQAMERNPYIPPPDDAEADDILPDQPADDDVANICFLKPLPMSLDKLERSIQAYIATPNAMESPEPLNFSTLPILEDSDEDQSGKDNGEDDAAGSVLGDMEFLAVSQPEKKKEKLDPAAAVYAIPELAALGRVFRSSMPVALTESETEYVVQCTKHIFDNHVVLQFSVENTIEDQRLDNVSVAIDTSESELFEATGEIPAESIPCGSVGSCFTILERTKETDTLLGSSSFTCELHFTVVQVDAGTSDEIGDSYAEEYPLEDLEIASADFIAKVAVGDFRSAWETMGSEQEVLEKFSLQFKTLGEAVTAIIHFLGMQPCDGTGSVKPTGKPHMLHLSGVFVGGHSILARAQIAMQNDGNSVLLKIAVRSDDENVSRMVADCIR